jgi:hypothetical protein
MNRAGTNDRAEQISNRLSSADLRLPRLFTCRLFALDPSIDPSVQHVHGQAAGTEYLVMELADIEARAKLLLCSCAQFKDL